MYPFGSPLPGRTFNSDSYRYGGANGQEKDVEIGSGIYTAEFWEYDSRLGRRWNLDPVDQVSISNYVCFGNNPIYLVDPLGDEVITHKERYRTMKDGSEKKLHWWNLRRADRIDITHTVVGAKMIDLTGKVPDSQMESRAKYIQKDIEGYWNTTGRADADENGYVTNKHGQKIKVVTKFETNIEVVKDVSIIKKTDNVWVVTTEERVNEMGGKTAQDIDMITFRNAVFMSKSSIDMDDPGGHAHEFGHVLGLRDRHIGYNRLMFLSGYVNGKYMIFQTPCPKPAYGELKHARGKKGPHYAIPMLK